MPGSCKKGGHKVVKRQCCSSALDSCLRRLEQSLYRDIIDVSWRARAIICDEGALPLSVLAARNFNYIVCPVWTSAHGTE